MKKAFLTLAFLISSVAFAAKKEVLPVKIEIVAESDGFQGRYNAGGWTGRIAGTRTFTSATTTKAIINGDHTLLSCEEHHSSCIVLGAGRLKSPGVVARQLSFTPAVRQMFGLITCVRLTTRFSVNTGKWPGAGRRSNVNAS